MTDLQRQTDFPEHTWEDWRALAEKGLRGEEFETLKSRTEDGLQRGPLFDHSDRPEESAPLPRGDAPLLDGRPWHICAPVMDPDSGFANKQLLSDLLGGASAVRVTRSGFTRAADVRRILEGVHVDLVPIIIDPKSDAAQFILNMDDFNGTSVTLGLSPLGERPRPREGWTAFTIEVADFHEHGATDAQELAIFTAIAVAAFRKHGTDAHSDLSALFATGADAHLGIVKIRAARWLYASIAKAFGVEDASLPIHVTSSLRMMQGEDAWTNMLRTMSAGFGAVAGGADYVTLQPFTELPEDRRIGDATPFGYRIARNQQLLMMEESHLGQVRDVAHGSYFHEHMTDALAKEAWILFQAIEAKGGFEAYRDSGALDADLSRSREARSERNDPILGVTLHPAEGVKKPEVR